MQEQNEIKLTLQEKQLITQWRELSEHSQNILLGVIESTIEHETEEKQKQFHIVE